tara:strand:- start:38062 stop:39102 length:1041 start_codon:yes stop_codon:yes gene_type:complete
MISLHALHDPKNKIVKSVKKFDWNRFIPGGWLDYGPPRAVTAYGDGRYYTDDGVPYGFKYGFTAWAASIPISTATTIGVPAPIPRQFLKTGILRSVRASLREYGAKVADHSGTGMWCNYYSERSHRISAHTDSEDYYERNFENEPLFVSLTLYEDGKKSLDNLARFQIRKENGDWTTIELPHLSLLVMSGNIEHRVLESVKSKPFRKRFNITFRTPVRYDYDIVKNYRFFSNAVRYYRKPFSICFPPNLEDKKKNKLLQSYKKISGRVDWSEICFSDAISDFTDENNLSSKQIRTNLLEVLDEFLQKPKYRGFKRDGKRPAKTSTNMALVVLLKNLILFKVLKPPI